MWWSCLMPYPMKLLITALLLVTSLAVDACVELVKTKMADESFPNEVAAVREMSRRFLETSIAEDVEFFGAVLRDSDGDYRATYGQGCRGVDQIRFSVLLTQGTKLCAFWHTHGRHGLARNLFSADDAASVLSHQLPFYLIDPAGLIRVLDPDSATPSNGITRVQGSHLRLSSRAYPGHIVSVGSGNFRR